MATTPPPLPTGYKLDATPPPLPHGYTIDHAIPGLERLGGAPPVAPAPQLPTALAPTPPGMRTVINQRTGEGRNFPAGGMTNTFAPGVEQAVRGVEQMAEPGMENRAAGASQVIRGTGAAVAPMIVPEFNAAPVRTAVSLAAGALAGKGAEAGLEAVGVPEGYAQLGGDVAAVGGGALAASPVPHAAIDLIHAPFKADPKVAIIRALKLDDPKLMDRIPSMETERIPSALSDIKASAPEGKIAGNEDFSAAAQAARDENRAAWNEWLIRAQGKQTSGHPILKATADSLSTTLSPEARAEILGEAEHNYGGALDTARLEELLHEKNGELAPFYAKDEGVQAAAQQAGARTGRSQALLESQARAIRDTLYQLLDPENSGAGPREIQQRYGAVKSLADASRLLRLGIIAEKPVSQATGIGKLGAAVLNVPGKLLHGDAAGAAEGIKNAFSGSSDPLIQHAIDSTNEAAPLPRPKNRLYPVGNPRQLTAGDAITPPPTDTSFVRSVPAVPNPPNPARALPAPSTIITPTTPTPDGSYVRSVPAVPNPPNPSRALPAPGKPPIITPAPADLSGMQILDAVKGIARDPKTGRIFKYYTSEGK